MQRKARMGKETAQPKTFQSSTNHKSYPKGTLQMVGGLPGGIKLRTSGVEEVIEVSDDDETAPKPAPSLIKSTQQHTKPLSSPIPKKKSRIDYDGVPEVTSNSNAST